MIPLESTENIYEILDKGPDALKNYLLGLEMPEIRKIIRKHVYDPANTTRNWDKERLADFVVKRTLDRVKKGDVFRSTSEKEKPPATTPKCEMKKEPDKDFFMWHGHPVLVEFTRDYKDKIKQLGDLVKWRKFAHDNFDLERDIVDKNGKLKFSVKMFVPFYGNGGIEALSGEKDAERTTELEVEETLRKILAEKLTRPYVKAYTIVNLDELVGMGGDRCRIVVE